jgi:hypothetical protein
MICRACQKIADHDPPAGKFVEYPPRQDEHDGKEEEFECQVEYDKGDEEHWPLLGA